MIQFTKGHGFVPYDGGKYELVHEFDGTEFVVQIRYDFGPPFTVINLETEEELSKELQNSEIKAWKEL